MHQKWWSYLLLSVISIKTKLAANIFLTKNNYQMKQLMTLMILIAFATLISCDGVSTKTPEGAVKGFYNAISAMDFEKAESFVTKESKEVIGLLKGLKQMGDDEAMKDIEDKKAEKVKCEIDGDKAECEVCCDEDGNFSDEKFNVKKVAGKWLVSISKEDMNKEDDMDMDFDMDMDEETDEE